MTTKTKPKNKTEELRLDILHNAPLPNSTYRKISFSDIESLHFVQSDGTFMEVVHYEVSNNKSLAVILK